MLRAPLRLCIALSGANVTVSFDGPRAEQEDALAFCPDLSRVLNDAMANIRRHYTKLPLRGEAARHTMVEMAARLRDRVANDERTSQLDVSVRATYEKEVTTSVRVDAETGRVV